MGQIRHRRAVVGAAAAALTASLTIAGANLGAASAGPDQSRGASSSVTKSQGDGMMRSRVKGTTEDGRQVRGAFVPENVTNDGQDLMVTGTLTGKIFGKGKGVQRFSEEVTWTVKEVNGTTLADAAGAGAAASGVRQSATSGGTALVTPAAASCDVLNLVLGPLDLNLLGLEVHLDQVVLDIVAQSGAGNLLGNLLCAVAGLLDGGLPLNTLLGQLTDLLNQILGVLGGLSV